MGAIEGNWSRGVDIQALEARRSVGQVFFFGHGMITSRWEAPGSTNSGNTASGQGIGAGCKERNKYVKSDATTGRPAEDKNKKKIR